MLLTLAMPPNLAAQSALDYASGVHSAVPLPPSAGVQAAAPGFAGVNITVNSPAAGAQNETTIAINPTNPPNMIGGANDYRGGDSACGRYRSADSGRTWTDSGTFPMFTPAGSTRAFTAAGDAGVAFDANGHGYYLCMYFTRTPGSDATQYVHKSTDGGATWGPPIPVSTAAAQANFDDKGHVAVDNRSFTIHRGNVYVAWARLNANQIRFARSTNNGLTFEADILVATGTASGANVAVANNGDVYVAWWEMVGGNSEIRIARSTDGGANFGAATTVRTFTGIGPAVRPLARVNSFPVIATDASNDAVVYAVWPENPAGNDDSDIMFSRSTNNGANWDPPSRVTDDVNPTGDFHSQFFPWMAVDPVDGSINIVWYDDRMDPDRTDTTRLVDLFFASSTDGGLSFGINKRVSTQSSNTGANFPAATPFFGDYNGIAAYGGVAYPLWTDSRTGDQEVMTVQVGGADLVITKTPASTTGSAGSSVLYTISVTNNGPAVAFNVVVTDSLPAGTTFQGSSDSCSPAAGGISCPLGDLSPGENVTFTVQIGINANVSSGTTLSNSASVSSDEEDPISGNNVATASIIVTAIADLRVTKQCKPDGPVAAGGIGTCTILVDNLGPSDAQSVVIRDTLVSNGSFTIVSVVASPGATINVAGNVVTVTFGSVPAGGRVTVAVAVMSTAEVDVNDTATVSSSTPDPDTGNNLATGSVQFRASADTLIMKISTPNPVTAGTNVTYTITVTNNGVSTATNVVMTDTLPAQISDVSFSPSQGSCIGGIPGNPALPLTCNLGSLASGASATITVVAKVDPATPEGTILVNNAVVTSDTSDPNNANNNATALTTVNTRADVAIVKTSDATTYKPSSRITYRIDVTNNGSSVARAVVVTDNLPDVRQALYQSDTGGCLRNSATNPTQLRCEVGDLAVGQTRTFFVVLLVRGNKGTISNTVSVVSTTTDPTTGNNTSTRNVTVGK